MKGAQTGATVNCIGQAHRGIHIQMSVHMGKHMRALLYMHIYLQKHVCLLTLVHTYMHKINKHLGLVFGVVRGMGKPSPFIKG